jgi:hypothetical protein
MIRDDMFDTKAPSNLYDEDFDENTKVLPPSRPMSEITTFGFVILKHGLTMVFGRVVDQANSTEPVSYDDVMKLDRMVIDAKESLPADCK